MSVASPESIGERESERERESAGDDIVVPNPSGDPPAEFGFDEACLDGDQLATVLQDGADWYQALVSGERQNTEEKALPEIVPAIVDGPGLTSAAVARHLFIAVPALLALVA